MTEEELTAQLNALRKEIDAGMAEFKRSIDLLEAAIITLSDLDPEVIDALSG